MRRLQWFLRCLIAITLAATGHLAWGGGVIVNHKSVEFSGDPLAVLPDAEVSLSFQVHEYLYGSPEFSYLIAALVPAGKGNADWRKLLNSSPVYGTLLSTPDGPRDIETASRPFSFTFRAPTQPGRYTVVLGEIPYFSRTPLHADAVPKRLFEPTPTVRQALIAQGAAYLQEVGTITVTPRPAALPVPSVYLQVDGQLPYKVEIAGGLQEHPLTFSWFVGKEFKGDRSKLLFRYQLSPEDEDWGAWTPMQSASYTFLQRGVVQFRVQARYTDTGRSVESQPASFQFNLPKDLIAKPGAETLTKAPFGVSPALLPAIAFNEVYAKSRALLVGLWEFDDKASFPQFDGAKISADLAAMEQALTRNGFTVTMLKRARVKQEEIADALANLVDSAGENDRLFVYFSTHGFADPLMPGNGYLATSDCKLAQPTSRCLLLNDLQTQADRALGGKHVRQVLFAIDSCFSGLGIVRKAASGKVDLTRLAVPQGAFMLTAGMASQVAQIDPVLGMSTFTHFLAEGLNGKGDVLGNNQVITLTQLFVYVQYEVARQTGSQQIPMLGRMKGDGEMLFSPSPSAQPSR